MQGPTKPPYQQDLVLIGGGHSHVQVLKRLAMKGGLPRVRITLISDASIAYYSGMLPGCLAELYSPQDIQMELRPLARWSETRFIKARVTGIDPALRTILFDDRPPIGYDVLSINIGSISRGMDVPGVREHAIATRPINKLISRINVFESQYNSDGKIPQVVVVGGGAAGVELAFAMHTRWKKRYNQVNISLVDNHPQLLQGHGTRIEKITRQNLEAKNIHLYQSVKGNRMDSNMVYLDNGESIPYDLVLWATGGAAPPLLAESGFETDEDGFLKVLPTLQTTTHENIFAAGDCIDFVDRPLPKAGVYAVREGPVLAHNIRSFIQKKPLKPFKPQPVILALLMTGDGRGICSWKGLGAQGAWLWILKDWIDRRWMKKFDPALFPPMDPNLVTKDQTVNIEETMRCAGCGSKVGSTILTPALDALKILPNPRVKIGLDHPDDAAVVKIPHDRDLVQTVDYFRAFIDDPYVFGRIAVLHAASDLFAMGATPDTALIIATLPYAAKSLLAGDIEQLMAGIVFECNRMGASITGGHTSEGSELSVGVVINGLCKPDQLFTKSGLQIGDYLVLTKPLGTGSILAADMRMKAKGIWMEAAIENMLVSNGPAADIFQAADVQALTDVTGFGLGGHLVEMLQASGVSGEIFLDRLPYLNGARECIAQNIFSTLAPSNQEHLEKRWNISGATTSSIDILYDPQTSGGLLAGVTPENLDKVLHGLHHLGYGESRVIGQVIEGKRQLYLTADSSQKFQVMQSYA